MSQSHAVAYEALRGRVRALVADCPDDVLAQPSPATPQWRVVDVVAQEGSLEDYFVETIGRAA